MESPTIEETVASDVVRKRKLSEGTTKPKRKRPPREGDGHFYKYWEVRETGEDDILKAVNTINGVQTAFRINPTSVALQLEKSMSLHQVRALIKDQPRCEVFGRMEVALFRQLSRSSSDAKNSKPRFYPTNSYYMFQVIGDTVAERHRNVSKVIDKVFDQQRHLLHGIKDLHFLEIDTRTGCLSVSNRKNSSFDPASFFNGVLSEVTACDREAYAKKIKIRTMRCQIRSWYAIGPFFGGDLENISEKLGKSVACHKIYANGVGIFQFVDDNLSITPFEAAVAMGVTHKSLCFQVRGDLIKDTLTRFEDEEVLSSEGDLKFRSNWKSNPKRPSKCLKFFPKDGKITDADILAMVNSENMLHNFFYREDRTFGVANCSKKQVPNTIDIGANLEWTSVTIKEYNNIKKTRDMNCLRVMRKGKASSFKNISSTHFSFENIPRELIDAMTKQKRVAVLTAAKYTEGGEDLYRGVVKTCTSAKARNLCPRFGNNVHPLGKDAFDFKLGDLKNTGVIDIDHSNVY